MNNTNLIAAASTVASDVKAFRSAAVTADNKATPFARSLMAALIAGVYTKDLAISAIIHAFGNPKSPKSGKGIEKLSGLRDFAGGDAVRKTAETAFAIVENIDTDKAGDAMIRKAIVAFILNESGAAKSLRALESDVKALIRAYAKATLPDNSEAAAETDAETADAKAAPAPAAPAEMTLAERINALTVAVMAAGLDEMSDAQAAMTALCDKWDAHVMALTAPAPEALAA